jgi:hypothetical protein
MWSFTTRGRCKAPVHIKTKSSFGFPTHTCNSPTMANDMSSKSAASTHSKAKHHTPVIASHTELPSRCVCPQQCAARHHQTGGQSALDLPSVHTHKEWSGDKSAAAEEPHVPSCVHRQEFRCHPNHSITHTCSPRPCRCIKAPCGGFGPQVKALQLPIITSTGKEAMDWADACGQRGQQTCPALMQAYGRQTPAAAAPALQALPAALIAGDFEGRGFMNRPSARLMRHTSGALPTTMSSAANGAYARSRPNLQATWHREEFRLS